MTDGKEGGPRKRFQTEVAVGNLGMGGHAETAQEWRVHKGKGLGGR